MELPKDTLLIKTEDVMKLRYKENPTGRVHNRFFLAPGGIPVQIKVYEEKKGSFVDTVGSVLLNAHGFSGFPGFQSFMGQVELARQLDKYPKYREEEGVRLLPLNALLSSWVEMINVGTTCRLYISSKIIDVNQIVIPIMGITGIREVIAEYILRKDWDIKVWNVFEAAEVERVAGEIELSNYFKELWQWRYEGESNPWTKAEMEFIASMIIIAMCKNINEEGLPEKVIQARAREFCASLRVTIREDKLTTMLDKFFLIEAYTAMSYSLKKLKSAINIHVFSSMGPFADYIRSIFPDAKLTVFNMIVNFVIHAEMKAIHVDQVILRQSCDFLNVFADIKKKYGVAWPYAKLIEPYSLETTHIMFKRFKSLALAAFAYVVTNSFDSLDLIPIPRNWFHQWTYARLCFQKIPNDYLTQPPVVAFDRLRKFYKAQKQDFLFATDIKDFQLQPTDEVNADDFANVEAFVAFVKRRYSLNKEV